ncbi:MFS transporter [Aneurinibacillus terranovensis]|uniref:MFS transporter n=1 Tax=Aneurinibacillus terranovensis TaxID=278991 RepID=UPI00041C8B31|nr:MFS transporter [Aneurinibacillus terranovensis]
MSNTDLAESELPLGTSRQKEKITPYMWKVFAVSLAGYIFDSMEIMLYSIAMVDISKEFHLSLSAAGLLMTLALLGYAVGGFFWGPLTDRKGRTWVLMWTVGLYSVFTGLTALSWSLLSLSFFRFLTGFASGGEWAAGAAMMSETWPAHLRGRAIALMQAGWPIGAIIASVLYKSIAPDFGWRSVFLIGIIPALLVLFVRRSLKETEHFQKAKIKTGNAKDKLREFKLLLSPQYRKSFFLLFITASIGLLGYYTIMTWIPGYLQKTKGFTVFKTANWFMVINLASAIGYYVFGMIADRIGRRPTFTIFYLIAMISAPLFAFSTINEGSLLLIGALLGFSMGYFSGFPAYGSELFPTHIRATGLGITYTGFSRVISTLGPFAIGILADKVGISVGIGIMGALFIPAIIVLWWLGHETKGKTIEELDGTV